MYLSARSALSHFRAPWVGGITPLNCRRLMKSALSSVISLRRFQDCRRIVARGERCPSARSAALASSGPSLQVFSFVIWRWAHFQNCSINMHFVFSRTGGHEYTLVIHHTHTKKNSMRSVCPEFFFSLRLNIAKNTCKHVGIMPKYKSFEHA